MKICVDAKLQDAVNQKYDVVILPGGLGGSKAFADVSKINAYV